MGITNVMPELTSRAIEGDRDALREHLIATLRRVQINVHPEWWFMPEPERSVLREREAVAP